MAVDNTNNSVDETNDLGRARFDHDTAAVGDRDNSFWTNGPVLVRQGRAPAGMEQGIFQWNTFQYETSDRDSREELKGDLHGGQLHRQNRAARGEPIGPPPPPRDTRKRRGGGMGQEERDGVQVLVCGRESENAPNMAKGKPKELEDELFWEEPIC